MLSWILMGTLCSFLEFLLCAGLASPLLCPVSPRCLGLSNSQLFPEPSEVTGLLLDLSSLSRGLDTRRTLTLSALWVQCLANHCFIYFVLLLVVSGGRANLIPIIPSWSEAKVLDVKVMDQLVLFYTYGHHWYNQWKSASYQPNSHFIKCFSLKLLLLCILPEVWNHCRFSCSKYIYHAHGVLLFKKNMSQRMHIIFIIRHFVIFWSAIFINSHMLQLHFCVSSLL